LSIKREKTLFFGLLQQFKKFPEFLPFIAIRWKNAQLLLHLSIKTLMPPDCQFLC
jgi:hypothetical protein